jgi:hypothetical protein
MYRKILLAFSLGLPLLALLLIITVLLVPQRMETPKYDLLLYSSYSFSSDVFKVVNQENNNFELNENYEKCNESQENLEIRRSVKTFGSDSFSREGNFGSYNPCSGIEFYLLKAGSKKAEKISWTQARTLGKLNNSFESPDGYEYRNYYYSNNTFPFQIFSSSYYNAVVLNKKNGRIFQLEGVANDPKALNNAYFISWVDKK